LHGPLSLDLSQTNVTDGLALLAELRGLHDLDVSNGPHVTAEGVARLRKALPLCKVVR
jgi:hypothetical protein